MTNSIRFVADLSAILSLSRVALVPGVGGRNILAWENPPAPWPLIPESSWSTAEFSWPVSGICFPLYLRTAKRARIHAAARL
jgi:hypothetical protein